MNGETPNTTRSGGREKAQDPTGYGIGAGALFFFRKMREFGRARSAAEVAATQTEAGVGFWVQTLLCPVK